MGLSRPVMGLLYLLPTCDIVPFMKGTSFWLTLELVRIVDFS
jgi:hypothetical protein